MPDHKAASPPARPYVSRVRDEQARRTRRAVVTAARELFLTQGYAPTTIDAGQRRRGAGQPAAP